LSDLNLAEVLKNITEHLFADWQASERAKRSIDAHEAAEGGM